MTAHRFYAMAKRAKRTYNTTGLQQGPQSIGEESESLNEKWDPHMYFDSLKLDVEAEDNAEDKTGTPNSELKKWDSNWDVDLELNTDLQVHLIKQAQAFGDDRHDKDWVPLKI